MSLLTLPHELLCHIILQTSPRAFESFMLSCRAIYEAGEQFIERHNDLCRKYRRFEYDSEVTCALQLLYRIAQDPVVADYIEIADFLEDKFPDNVQQCDVENWPALLGDGNAIVCIEEFVRNSKSLRTDIFARMWLKATARGREEVESSLAMSIIVLSLLKNVQELVLPKQWARFPPPMGNSEVDERDDLWRALDSFVQELHIDCDTTGPLSNVSLIHPFHLIRSDGPIGLQVLSPFLILPSLKELRASNCLANRDWRTGKPFNWRYPQYQSTLERIQLASCCMIGSELANLLKHTPNLQSFKFSYETKWWASGKDWDANEFLLAIRSHCSKTLTELSITIDRIGCIKSGLCTLKEFTRLEHVELDVRLFFGPPVTGDLLAMEPADYRLFAYQNLWNGTMVPSLANILPSSIKTVRLLAGSSREDILILKSLFAHLDVRVADCLPNLENITVVRAKTMIGDENLPSNQFETAWKSVSDVVKSSGGQYEEWDVVRASFLRGFYQRRVRGGNVNTWLEESS